jgi:hypothetical protein
LRGLPQAKQWQESYLTRQLDNSRHLFTWTLQLIIVWCV